VIAAVSMPEPVFVRALVASEKFGLDLCPDFFPVIRMDVGFPPLRADGNFGGYPITSSKLSLIQLMPSISSIETARVNRTAGLETTM
jgi:hypothetical protein